MQRLTISIMFLVLTACAAPQQTRVTDAVTTPLTDLNLVQSKIPEVLVEAQKQPYAAPVEQSCAALSAAVKALDEVLGPDFDAPATASDPTLVERGTTFMSDAAIGSIRGAAEGIVPFRSWVRKLSGAERHSREGAAAIAAGTVRRAFLKGVISTQSCL